MNDRIEIISLDAIEPHPANRKIGGFDPEKLEQLAESIRAVGVQQPAKAAKK
ncbi:MAG: ParB N-terminal domain-containing protein [Spirochaetota bacterium]|nr:ParB N-terminal domain-containing protein [Spirochaetota bacterium]HPV99208.1 ParB N-terminal domain-containing protein [Spirochaetota bacterium]